MATDVATTLPQVDLLPNSTITVTLSDPAAVITKLSVHGFQDDSEPTPTVPSPVTGAYTTA